MPNLRLIQSRETHAVLCGDDDLRDPAALRDGALYSSIATRTITAHTTLPVRIALHWLRETSRGLRRHPLPLLFDAESPATFAFTLRGPIRFTVRRSARQLHCALRTTSLADAIPGVSASVLAWDPPSRDPLLAALLGVHPLDWFREVVTETGSREQGRAVWVNQIPPPVAEQLHALWSALPLDVEADAWDSFKSDGLAARAALGGHDHLFTLVQHMHAHAQRLLRTSPLNWWALARIEEFLGPHQDVRLSQWTAIRNRLYQGGAHALALDAARHFTELLHHPATLAQSTFNLDPDGLERYARLLAGDLSASAPLFTRHLRPRLEIELPFRSRDEIRDSPENFHNSPLATLTAGRLALAPHPGRRALLLALGGEFAHQGRRWDSAPACLFSFPQSVATQPGRDRFDALASEFGIGPLPWPSGPVTATLTAELPGDVFAAWTRAPHPREPQFGELFSLVAAGVQTLLRRWIPTLCLPTPEHYADTATAYPLLAYAATPPAPGGPSAAFAYDTTVSASLRSARRGALLRLPSVMAAAEALLERAGVPHIAALYHPSCFRQIGDSARRTSSRYLALLRSEAQLIDLLLRLAESVRELRWTLASTPSVAGRSLARTLSRLTRTLDRHLSAHGAAPLAPLLLMTATCALAGHSLRDQVRARVTIEHRGLLWSFPQSPIPAPPPSLQRAGPLPEHTPAFAKMSDGGDPRSGRPPAPRPHTRRPVHHPHPGPFPPGSNPP